MGSRLIDSDGDSGKRIVLFSVSLFKKGKCPFKIASQTPIIPQAIDGDIDCFRSETAKDLGAVLVIAPCLLQISVEQKLRRKVAQGPCQLLLIPYPLKIHPCALHQADSINPLVHNQRFSQKDIVLVL